MNNAISMYMCDVFTYLIINSVDNDSLVIILGTSLYLTTFTVSILITKR